MGREIVRGERWVGETRVRGRKMGGGEGDGLGEEMCLEMEMGWAR